jgi:hypothetical protein
VSLFRSSKSAEVPFFADDFAAGVAVSFLAPDAANEKTLLNEKRMHLKKVEEEEENRSPADESKTCSLLPKSNWRWAFGLPFYPSLSFRIPFFSSYFSFKSFVCCFLLLSPPRV